MTELEPSFVHRKSKLHTSQSPTDAKLKVIRKIKIYHRFLWFRSRYFDQKRYSVDLLLRYRARELQRLINEGQRLNAFNYELYSKLLDHIEVIPAGKLVVAYLTGTRIII